MPLLDDLMEKQGREMEAARFLRQILEHRFGPLPEWAAERLASLPADRLEGMIGQVLEASTLEEALRL